MTKNLSYQIDVPQTYGNTFSGDLNCTIYFADFMVNNGYVSMSYVFP